MSMNPLERITLLQALAKAIDSGTATALEIQAFDCITEILNEQIKNRNASNHAGNYFAARSRRIRDANDS